MYKRQTEGRVVNPGHDIECSWFLMEYANYLGDRELHALAEEMCIRDSASPAPSMRAASSISPGMFSENCFIRNTPKGQPTVGTVSYTHLDVYKRQCTHRPSHHGS